MPYYIVFILIVIFTSVEAGFYLIDQSGDKTNRHGLLIVENIGSPRKVLFKVSIHYINCLQSTTSSLSGV